MCIRGSGRTSSFQIWVPLRGAINLREPSETIIELDKYKLQRADFLYASSESPPGASSFFFTARTHVARRIYHQFWLVYRPAYVQLNPLVTILHWNFYASRKFAHLAIGTHFEFQTQQTPRVLQLAWPKAVQRLLIRPSQPRNMSQLPPGIAGGSYVLETLLRAMASGLTELKRKSLTPEMASMG